MMTPHFCFHFPGVVSSWWATAVNFIFISFLMVSSTTTGVGIEAVTAAATSAPDVVAIMPNRATAYPNGLHNGMILSARRYNITLEIRDVGNFDPSISLQVLRDAIMRPAEEQPKIYCIWPVDLPSKNLVQELYLRHQVPIIQLNQLPGPDSQWEWEHLLGYAGPDDGLRASNAGIMMVEALQEKQAKGLIPADMKPRVVALGYPETYGGYHLSIAAFREAIKGSNLNLVQSLPLNWGSQNAYNAVVQLINEMEQTGNDLHGIYAMDDDILKGAYQAIHDRGLKRAEDIVLVGTVCNGGRSLLRDGFQYGTTVQSPFLESVLAMDSVVQYLTTGQLNETIRFTPNPSLTGTGYEDLVLDFLGESYVADDLCTWELEHTRSNGIQDVNVVSEDFLCNWIECLFIPNEIFIVGYVLAGINYIFAIASAFGLWYFRSAKVVNLAQPGFLLLIIFGAVIDTTSIIFMSRDNRNYSNAELDRSCTAWTTLLTFGQMVTTATLVAKIYRVRAVTIAAKRNQRLKAATATTIKRAEVRAQDVSGFIIGGLLFDAILLGSWFGTDPFNWTVRVVNEDSSGFILSARGECSSENPNYWLWPLAILAVHFCLLIYANVLAYQTRHFHRISDSKMVAICLFNSIQLLLVASVMLALSGDNVAISYVVRASYAFLNNVGVMALVVGPKLYLCLTGRGDLMPEVGKTSSLISQMNNSQSSPAASTRDTSTRRKYKKSSNPDGTNVLSSTSKRSNASNSNIASDPWIPSKRSKDLPADSWAQMGSVAETSHILKKLENISEDGILSHSNPPESAGSPNTGRRRKYVDGDETDQSSAGFESLLYPSEVRGMWESLGFQSVDHAKAVIDLILKDTTPKRRQEIINGAFLREAAAKVTADARKIPSSGGSTCSEDSNSNNHQASLGYENMISPNVLRNDWEILGFFEREEVEYVLEILAHDTTSERRNIVCGLLFDE